MSLGSSGFGSGVTSFFSIIDGVTSDVAFLFVPSVPVYSTSTFWFVGVSTFIIFSLNFSFNFNLYLKDAVSPAFSVVIFHVILLFFVSTVGVTVPIFASSNISKS